MLIRRSFFMGLIIILSAFLLPNMGYAAQVDERAVDEVVDTEVSESLDEAESPVENNTTENVTDTETPNPDINENELFDGDENIEAEDSTESDENTETEDPTESDENTETEDPTENDENIEVGDSIEGDQNVEEDVNNQVETDNESEDTEIDQVEESETKEEVSEDTGKPNESEKAVENQDKEKPEEIKISKTQDNAKNFTLKRGDRDEEVIKLKKDLEKLGFKVSNNPTVLFGITTEKKVKEFQKYYGLMVNGFGDGVTLDYIQKLLNIPLQKGKKDQSTIQLKKDLEKLGFKVSNNPTTLYGVTTEKKVKEFQKYYGLMVNGFGDGVTLDYIQKLLNTSLQKGEKDQSTIQLKKDLEKLGFKVSNNPTTLYGVTTEKKVKEFQKYYGLIVNGFGDGVTLDYIQKLLNTPLQKGKKDQSTIQLKKDLEKLGFKVSNNPTTLYGVTTEKKVKEFQKYYGLIVNGFGDSITLEYMKQVLSSKLQQGKRNQETIKLKQDLEKLGFKVSNNPTTLYGVTTAKKVREFQKRYNLAINGIADKVTLKKIASLIKNLPTVKTIKIFLDAGHGGSDPGASANGLQEKDLTLAITKYIGQYLGVYANVEIMYSRTTDKYLSLNQRTEMANKWGADFFFSTHINSGGGTGIESFVFPNSSATTKKYQKVIHDQIAGELTDVRDRGKKQADFHVLRESTMPALLFEYLFIDNKNDSNKLKQDSYLKKMAKATAEGIAKALGLKK